MNHLKWITNFIVDAYLQLVKSESAQKGVKVEIFRWEEFEKLVQRQTLKDPLTDKDDLFKQDAVLSYDPYSPARAFIAKLLRKSPYEGRTH